ncbi:hypothetical protein AYL99_05801 [Fonsecaea erecta]|uniref:Protein kinase domain-containing protein n=1 Tax=Fonsecaea erecta TaxID=1367422 RepID=A0A178ZLW4_9EURO|nr:hypothetical protein AYL99_05801 [Fonsecaea erecta]OAP60799.1 hypothetical protein AYL99_05801 [Fonsecaea erecta]
MTLEFRGTICRVLGDGSTGVVILYNDTAIKLPKSVFGGANDDDDDDRKVIEWEKEVYRRLDNCEGVISCIDLSGDGIKMAWMENGNLRDYLAEHNVPLPMRLSWLRHLAHTLAAIHDRRVIEADLSPRNILVAKDMSVKFSDFTESSLLPLDCDMETVDDNGYSMQTDIGQFGALMYEVSTGVRCTFDLFENQPLGPATTALPKRDSLPPTEGVWLGAIIESAGSSTQSAPVVNCQKFWTWFRTLSPTTIPTRRLGLTEWIEAGFVVSRSILTFQRFPDDHEETFESQHQKTFVTKIGPVSMSILDTGANVI